MHRAAILAGIRDGRRGSRETPEILRDRDAAEIDIRQIGLDGDRGRDLAGLQQLAHHVENRAVHLLVEVLGQRKSDTRSKASLFTRIAPSRACSASRLCGASRRGWSAAFSGARRARATMVVIVSVRFSGLFQTFLLCGRFWEHPSHSRPAARSPDSDAPLSEAQRRENKKAPVSGRPIFCDSHSDSQAKNIRRATMNSAA